MKKIFLEEKWIRLGAGMLALQLLAVGSAHAENPESRMAQREELLREGLPVGFLISRSEIPALREKVKSGLGKVMWEEIRAMERGTPGVLSALCYLVTGDPSYAERGKASLFSLIEKNWGHEIDGSRLCRQAAIGYDWLYDDLTEEERARVREAIAQKYMSRYAGRFAAIRGLLRGGEGSYDARLYQRWRLECNIGVSQVSAFGYGALVLEDKHPEGKKWMALAEDMLAHVLSVGFDEDGVMAGHTLAYHGISLRAAAVLVEALRRVKGIDYTLCPNFRNALEVNLAALATVGDCVLDSSIERMCS